MITSLKPNEVFVFGSNLAGIHAGGAARQAKEQFAAKDGVGEGITGQCYAFPTLDEDFQKRSWVNLRFTTDTFFEYAVAHSDKKFLMTPVGTGIAGYDVDYMKSLFQNPPTNVVLPEEWTT